MKKNNKEPVLKIKHIKGLAELYKGVLFASLAISPLVELKCRTIDDFVDFISRHENEIKIIVGSED